MASWPIITPTLRTLNGRIDLREVRRHAAGCPQGDDITLLCSGRS